MDIKEKNTTMYKLRDEINNLKSELIKSEKQVQTYKDVANTFENENKKLEDKLKKTKERHIKIIKEFEKKIENLQIENREYKDKIETFKGKNKGGRKKIFTEQQIEEIKKQNKDGKSIRKLAKMFNCSIGTIHNIIK